MQKHFHFSLAKQHSNYHIYPYKRPVAMHFSKGGAIIKDKKNPHSSPVAMGDNGHFSTFAKFIFRGFTSLSTATSLVIPGFRKKMRFSTSPIEYCLREIKKITTHGNLIFLFLSASLDRTRASRDHLFFLFCFRTFMNCGTAWMSICVLTVVMRLPPPIIREL